MTDEERLRSRIQRAIGYEPPSPGFGLQPLSHVVATRSSTLSASPQRHSMALALVAALIALAIVISFVLAGQVLRSRSSIPAHTGPAPWTAPTPVRTEICRSQCEVATQQAFPPKPGRAAECGGNGCAVQAPVFATPQLAWITEGFAGSDGPVTLYRTDDGGQHWHPVISWDGPGATQVRTTADGSEALIVTARNSEGVATAFHTTDSGAHWTARGLPFGIDSDLVYFLNPTEGWILRSANFDLVHTTDGGAHWTQVARLDGMLKGGSLVFLTSLNGMYLLGSFLYVTHDGGATWGLQNPPRPSDVPASAYVGSSKVKFFNSHDGVLEFEFCTAVGCPSARDYVYTTPDGGIEWTAPLRLPTAEDRNIFIFIDQSHWIRMDGGIFNAHGVIETADAGQHWSVLLSPPSNSNMVEGPWDMVEHPDFFDPLHGWALVPSLYVTTDGGRTWVEAQFLPS
jgi:photosystem II stability/assembly factor-like uncharacterized protein